MRRRHPPQFAEHHLPKWHPYNVLAAAWAWRAIRTAQRGYAARKLHEVAVPSPPGVLPDDAVRGVHAMLVRTSQRCLVRATVLQAWEAGQGRDRALIIGVTKPSDDFRAHAWLDGDPPCHSDGYEELLRRSR